MDSEKQYCIYCRRELPKNKRRKNQWHVACHKSIYGTNADIFYQGELIYKKEYSILVELEKEIQYFSNNYKFVKLTNLIHMFENVGYVISNKAVIGLDLKFQIQTDFYKFNSLEILHLTQFTEIKADISKLKKLKKLVLKHCNIKDLPESFGRIPQLEYLEISGITGLHSIPESVGNLKKLKTFILAPINESVKIQDLPSSITNLHRLEYFYISSTNIKKLPEGFENLSNLQELYILSRSITEIPPLMNFKKLRVLECQAKLEFLPESFSELSDLEEVKLFNNMLEVIPNVSKLQRLIKLQLFNSFVTEIPDGLLNLKKLKSLSLYQSPIRLLPEELFKLERLEEINVSQTNLTKLPIKFIFNDLKSLNLEKTFVTQLPEDIFLPKLEELRISCYMTGIEKFWSLKTLYITNTLPGKELESFPKGLFELTNLISLDIGEAKFISLPDAFEKLSKLRILYLHKTKIRDITGIPTFLIDKVLDRNMVIYVHPAFDLSGMENTINLRIKY